MRTFIAAFASLVLAAACGSSDPAALTDAGVQSLRSGNHASALSSFESALTAIGGDTSHPEFKRAKMGEIEARLHTDPERAKNDFLKLGSAGIKTTEDDFYRVGDKMAQAKKFMEGIALLEAGKEAFPDSELLDRLGKNMAKLATQAGDASAQSALAGLGYL